MKFVLYLQTLSTLIFYLVVADDILVGLPNGVVQGRQDKTHTNKTFNAFQSIPYAAPPTGKLRFMPPVPSENWEGILDATKITATCYQMSFESATETEDCLRLNVYSPQLPNGEDLTLLPTMFFIYGGGFIFGSSEPYGPHFLIEEDVVVVTINYRVGPFGFLSTQDTVIPGNAGLKDQLLALQWTHDNIALFGGDPEKITIFGQSAGSASVNYLLLHTESEGLFRGAIGESGSALSPWAFQRKARKFAFTLGGYIDESFKESNDSGALLEFLQNANVQEIQNASNLISQLEEEQNRQLSQGFFFAPVIESEHEGAFITEKMYGKLKSGDFIKVPVLMGINSEECINESEDLDMLKHRMSSYDENLDWLVPDDTQIEDIDKRKEIGQLIRQIYVGDSTFQENLGAGIRYLSDTSFTRSVIMQAELQSQFSDVYFYQFSYDGIIGNISATIEGAEKVAHSEETKYIWSVNVSDYDNSDLSVFPENDQITVQRMLKIFTQFARTLYPLPQDSELFTELEIWPKVNERGQPDFIYVDIDVNLTMKINPKKNEFRRWNEIYANLGYDDFDTF